MAVVEVVEKQYASRESVQDLMNYIADLSKCKSMISGGANIIGSIFADPYSIASQFIYVQGYGRFKRRLYHVIISPDSVLDQPDSKLMYRIGDTIANIYNEYQSVYTVHENTSNMHIHMVLNNCSFLPGKEKLTARLDRRLIQSVTEQIIDEHLGIR